MLTAIGSGLLPEIRPLDRSRGCCRSAGAKTKLYSWHVEAGRGWNSTPGYTACQVSNPNLYSDLGLASSALVEVHALTAFLFPSRRPFVQTLASILACLTMSSLSRVSGEEVHSQGYWAVEDIKEGMKGIGKTVMHGVEIEEFDAVVLGVQRNSSPGRDTVL